MKVGNCGILFPIIREYKVDLSMSLVILLKKNGTIEATADGMAIVMDANGALKHKKDNFKKLYPLKNKAIIGYASQTPINGYDLSSLTDSLAFYTKGMSTISEIANESCEFIRGTEEPHPDQILIGGVDTEPGIYKLERCYENFKPQEVLYEYDFIGWIHVAVCEYHKIKDKSEDIAVDLIQKTCDHPNIHGLIGGKLKRFVVDGDGVHEIEMTTDIHSSV